MERLQFEQQVCTVEQSKRLVALGVTADSRTCWIQDTMNPHWNNGYALSKLGYEAMQLLRQCEVAEEPARPAKRTKLTPPPALPKEIWPAYTVAELLALVVRGDYYATFFADGKWWFIDLRNEDAYRVAQDPQKRRGYDTEAQARAAMAIEVLQYDALEYCRKGHEMPFALPA